VQLIEYPDREMMFIDLANRLAGEIGDCLRRHDFASFAVPGGTTPGEVFDDLSGSELDWPRVHVILTDERWLAEEDERSNARLVRERLLTDHAAAAVEVPIPRGGTPEEGARAWSEALAPHLPLSVLLLGMGVDMHTASLFPGAEGLEAAMAPGAPPALAIRAPGAAEPRGTLTAPVLAGAMSKHILITGHEKRDAVRRARKAGRMEAPVSAIWDGATVHWAE
jgi:6-phosphogluconolactonase